MDAAEATASPVAVQVTTLEALAQVHPAGAEYDWKVVPAGSVSVNVTAPEAFGPIFVTVCEKTMLLPASTELGEAWSVTLRSVPDDAVTVAVAELFAV
jgi:hypothetical protein